MLRRPLPKLWTPKWGLSKPGPRPVEEEWTQERTFPTSPFPIQQVVMEHLVGTRGQRLERSHRRRRAEKKEKRHGHWGPTDLNLDL